MKICCCCGVWASKRKRVCDGCRARPIWRAPTEVELAEHERGNAKAQELMTQLIGEKK